MRCLATGDYLDYWRQGKNEENVSHLQPGIQTLHLDFNRRFKTEKKLSYNKSDESVGPFSFLPLDFYLQSWMPVDATPNPIKN